MPTVKNDRSPIPDKKKPPPTAAFERIRSRIAVKYQYGPYTKKFRRKGCPPCNEIRRTKVFPLASDSGCSRALTSPKDLHRPIKVPPPSLRKP